VNISGSQDNELLAYEFQPSPKMLIGTDITLNSEDMGKKERDRLKKRKQVKKDKAKDSDQGTPTKHARTKGKHKVETTPKESDEGSKAEAEGIQEEEEEAEAEGIMEEQEEEQETKAPAKTPTKQAVKTLLKGILKHGKEETKPVAPKESDESSEVEGSSDEEEQKTEVLAKHIRAAKCKGKGHAMRGRKVEEESAKDEEEEEEEKDMSDIEEEKPAGWHSACHSEGKKGGAKGKAFCVTPHLCWCLSSFIADMGGSAFLTTRWRQGRQEKHQKERGIVPNLAPSVTCVLHCEGGSMLVFPTQFKMQS
jgi:hypothetical protein